MQAAVIKTLSIILSMLVILPRLPSALTLALLRSYNDSAAQSARVGAMRNGRIDQADEQRFATFDLTDETVRYNEVRTIATHNSYKKAMPQGLYDFSKIIWGEQKFKSTMYEHDTLSAQLGNGIRSFELDIRWQVNGFKIYHNGLPDNGSTCPDWKLALEELRLWSDANPGHVPITVLVEIKRDNPARNPLYADMDVEKFRQLDQTVADIVGAEKAVTPADLMGRWPTLGAMAQNGGWPSLAQLKGKIIFLLHPDSVYTRLYIGMDPSLKTQWFVPTFGAGETAVYPDDAAFLIANTPDIGLVRPLVARGCIVRVFMDYDRVYNAAMKDAALASGAQILTTDLEKGVVLPRSDYIAEFPGGYTVARNLPAQ